MSQESTGVMQGNSRDADKFVVRLPDGLRERIAVRAKSEHRSMNSFMIRALEAALSSEGTDSLSEVPVVTPQVSKPVFLTGMPCRYQGNPKVIHEIQLFIEQGSDYEFLQALLDFGDSQAYVSLDDLEPY